jgi:hypothetical protein
MLLTPACVSCELLSAEILRGTSWIDCALLRGHDDCFERRLIGPSHAGERESAHHGIPHE